MRIILSLLDENAKRCSCDCGSLTVISWTKQQDKQRFKYKCGGMYLLAIVLFNISKIVLSSLKRDTGTVNL